MKHTTHLLGGWSFFAIAAVASALIAPQTRAASLYDAQGNFVWGSVSQFELLAIGDGFSGGVNLSAPPGSTGYEVTGNVGISGTNTSLVISGSADIQGSVYLNTGDSINKSGAATITGSTITTQKSLLNSAEASAILISDMAESASQTYNWVPDSLSLGSNAKLTLQSTGHFVMDVNDFILGGGGVNNIGAILTLSGAANTTFVFNIYGDLNIGGGAKILLTGGITAADVLFNLVGCDSNAYITGDSLVNGTILATDGTVTVSGHNTEVNGQIIAEKICIQSGADVAQVSP